MGVAGKQICRILQFYWQRPDKPTNVSKFLMTSLKWQTPFRSPSLSVPVLCLPLCPMPANCHVHGLTLRHIRFALAAKQLRNNYNNIN